MKKVIQSVLFLVLLGCTPVTAQYLHLGERDSLGYSEYFPNKHLEVFDIKGQDKFLKVSVGIYNNGSQNVFYGIYIDFDSALVKKDTLLAIVTTTGSYLLREAKSSREMNLPFNALFVPDSNPDQFYGFIIEGRVTKISYSGSYFEPTINPDYFEKAMKEVVVIISYFD